MSIESYRDLEVWKSGMTLAEQCYLLTRAFPKEDLFGMTSQIRRASALIPANIAEGYGRDNPGDYVHMLRIANGSLKELETHLLLCVRVGLLTEPVVEQHLSEAGRLGRMLRGLIRSLQRP